MSLHATVYPSDEAYEELAALFRHKKVVAVEHDGLVWAKKTGTKKKNGRYPRYFVAVDVCPDPLPEYNEYSHSMSIKGTASDYEND